MSSKSPRELVSTPEISGRMPTSAAIASARLSSSSWNAEPTVPCPSRPTRNGPPASGVTEAEVLVVLAPHHHASVPVLAEDHRRPRHRVVVVRHGVAVGARGWDDEHVAGAGIVERDVAHQHVAGLAVHAGNGAEAVTAEAVGYLGVVARAVE